MKRTLALAALLFSFACTGARPSCESAEWSAAPSHMTNRIASPFVVRGITGRLVPTFANVWPSDSGGFPASFEIYKAGGSTLSIPIRSDGSFDVPVAEGTYCFRISSDVLQGYEGVIVVARNAALDSAVKINVDLGV